jgi:hypothetical protein
MFLLKHGKKNIHIVRFSVVKMVQRIYPTVSGFNFEEVVLLFVVGYYYFDNTHYRHLKGKKRLLNQNRFKIR